MRAADDGDQVARGIIQKNAIHMGKSIACLQTKRFSKKDRVPVVLTGGIYNRLDLFQAIIEKEIRQHQLNQYSQFLKWNLLVELLLLRGGKKELPLIRVLLRFLQDNQ